MAMLHVRTKHTVPSSFFKTCCIAIPAIELIVILSFHLHVIHLCESGKQLACYAKRLLDPINLEQE